LNETLLLLYLYIKYKNLLRILKLIKMCKRLILILLLFVFKQFLFAQEKSVWGRIPDKSDLEMKEWAADNTAEAVVLNNEGWIENTIIDNSYAYRCTEKKRIKILKKSAFDRANISIPYITKNNYDRFIKIEASIWTPGGRLIPVDPKTATDEKLNNRVSVKKLTFPNVEEGSILEYEFIIESKNVMELREWFFQEDIPVRKSQLNLKLDGNYSYTYLIQGNDKIKSSKPVYDSQNRTLIFYYSENLPGLKEEPYISTMDDYKARIRFQLLSLVYENGRKENMISTWENTASELWGDFKFGKAFTKKSDLEEAWKVVEATFSATDADSIKALKIYDYVRKNYVWNRRYSWLTPVTLKDVIKSKEGTSGQINLLLLGLLRQAELEANPVLIGTRNEGKVYEDYPIMDQFSHVLVHIVLGKNTMLLDAGSSVRAMGNICEEAMNSRGCLITKKGAQWIDIQVPVSTRSNTYNFTLEADGTFNGKVQTNLKGNIAEAWRSLYLNDAFGKELRKNWLTDYPEIKIDSIAMLNIENPEEPLKVNFNCQIQNAAQANDDKIYFRPTFYTGWEKSPLKAKERKFPVDMPYPISENHVSFIKIPAEYIVEELPKSITQALPNNDGQFQYQIFQKENDIQVSIRIRTKKLFFQPNEYDALKYFFDTIAAKLQEQVVLKKKEK
jgi:hypothetical protein